MGLLDFVPYRDELDPKDLEAKPKPSRLTRDVKKHAAKVQRDKAREKQDRLDRAADTARRKATYERDQGRSRASGVELKWQSRNPLEVAHAHHIKFRSRGGSDDLFNQVLLSPSEHDMAHARHPQFVLDIFGDANKTLTFMKKQVETGKVIERRKSPCPTPSTTKAGR